MSSAGQQLVAGRIPGEWIDGVQSNADSSTFTGTETVILTLADAPLVTGRTYELVAHVNIETTVADSRVIVRIREDNLAGNAFEQANVWPDFTGSIGMPVALKAPFTAGSTGNKTFVVTGVRASGTGTINMSGDASTPNLLDVYYRNG